MLGLHQVQGGVERLLGHVVNVDQHAALHHLFQQDLTVGAEAAPIGVAAEALGRVQGLTEVANARYLIEQRMMVHGAADGHRLAARCHRALSILPHVVPVVIEAIAHAGFPAILHIIATACHKAVGDFEEAQVDGRAAERIVGEVHRRDLPDAYIVEPVDLVGDQLARLFQAALRKLFQVFQATPVAQRIHLHAQDHGQPVVGDDGPGFVGGIGDLQPAAPRPAALAFHVFGHCLHAADLGLDGAAVVVV